MSYLPLARKYRPQTFGDLIGQPHVTATLTRALEAKRIAQAYLFSGLRGVGKTSAARILAKCLNCAKGPAAVPCNRCASCTQIIQGNSLDVIEIDGASNRGIDEIRNLRETIPFAPTSGQFRVYIIDEVHMLTTEAFNALLKTLEEPPAHIKFIFATTAPSKMPATILSRCQRFDFRRIDAATMVEVLKRVAKAEQVSIDDAACYAIARASEGSLRDAEVVLDQLASFAQGPIKESDVEELTGGVEAESLLALVQAILDRQVTEAVSAVVKQLERGREPSQILAGIVRHLRHLLVLRSLHEGGSQEEVVLKLVDEPAERRKRLEEQAASASAQEWLMHLQIAMAAYDMARRSPMAQAVLELAVIKLATREQWQSLEQISQKLEQLKAAPTSSPQPAAVTPIRPKAAALDAPQAVSSSSFSAVKLPADSDLPENVKAIWPVFIERLGKQKMSLAAYLMHAQPIQLSNQTLTVGLAGFSLHQEVLAVADNRRMVDQLLTELCGMKITVQYATLPEPAAAAAEPAASSVDIDGSTPSVVRDIVNLFNATVVQQPPRSG